MSLLTVRTRSSHQIRGPNPLSPKGPVVKGQKQEPIQVLTVKLKEGQRWLSEARKETVIHIPPPTSSRQIREFLGTWGFCRLWIPGFAELAAPLYPLTRDKQPFVWGNKEQQAFDVIKTAPALGLPDVTKSF